MYCSRINHLLVLRECQEETDEIEIRKTANELIVMKDSRKEIISLLLVM